MRALVTSCFLLALSVGCATSEDVPTVVRDLDGAPAPTGGAPAAGGSIGATGGTVPIGAGGSTGSAGSPFGGGTGAATGSGGSGNCGGQGCPDCATSAFFGTQCCKSDGTCGCKAFFGIGNCQ